MAGSGTRAGGGRKSGGKVNQGDRPSYESRLGRARQTAERIMSDASQKMAAVGNGAKTPEYWNQSARYGRAERRQWKLKQLQDRGDRGALSDSVRHAYVRRSA